MKQDPALFNYLKHVVQLASVLVLAFIAFCMYKSGLLADEHSVFPASGDKLLIVLISLVCFLIMERILSLTEALKKSFYSGQKIFFTVFYSFFITAIICGLYTSLIVHSELNELIGQFDKIK